MNRYEVKVFTARNLLDAIETKKCSSVIQAQYCFAEMCEYARESLEQVGCYVYLYDLQLERDIIFYHYSPDDDGVYEELMPCRNQY